MLVTLSGLTQMTAIMFKPMRYMWGADPADALLSRAGLCYLITLRKRLRSDTGRVKLLALLSNHLRWLSVHVAGSSGHVSHDVIVNNLTEFLPLVVQCASSYL